MSKEKKLAKKEAKAVKNEAAAQKAMAKATAKAEQKHSKAYDKYVSKVTKKNEKGKAAGGAGFTPIQIPTIDEFATKGEIKAEKAADKSYANLVKKIDKKNTKLEKKCAKKGTPFVPIPTPTQEEVLAGPQSKTSGVIWMVIMIVLILFLVYFMIRFGAFNYNPFAPVEDTTAPTGSSQEYETYSNPHEITTTPDYSIAEAKVVLKQTIHDNWKQLGYSSDPSSGSISYNSKVITVNGADCYVFTCSGKTFAVAVKLSAVYHYNNGEYEPLSFNNTNHLFK